MISASLAIDRSPPMDRTEEHNGPPHAADNCLGALTSFELVIRSKAGDTEARETLFVRYAGRLRRWAHSRLPSAARGALQTHDLVQETLLSVLEHLPTFNPKHEGAFQAYVRTTLRNRINDVLRQYQRRGAPAPLDPDLPGDESPYDSAVFTETLARYDAALDRLRPDDKELIIARVELGRSYPEITMLFEKPSVAATHMAVSRALVRLAEEMAHDRKR